MPSNMDINTLVVNPGDPGGDNKQIFVMQAPTESLGGGIRIVSASAVNGAATGSGTTFTYQLLRYSNAGTPAVNGTISDVLGGTAAPWGASVPKDFVITASDAFLSAGEWLVVDYQETNNGNPTNSVINIQYVMGT